jgi:hypothetical protein
MIWELKIPIFTPKCSSAISLKRGDGRALTV